MQNFGIPNFYPDEDKTIDSRVERGPERWHSKNSGDPTTSRRHERRSTIPISTRIPIPTGRHDSYYYDRAGLDPNNQCFSIITDVMSNHQKRVHFMREAEAETRTNEKDRIMGVLNVDAFECQIWRRKFPDYEEKPCVVADGNDRIVCVSMEAKEKGVTTNHRVPQAKEMLPELHVFVKPDRFNKPDTEEVRKAAWEITDVIKAYLSRKEVDLAVEYAPPDCWYFDFTEYARDLNRLGASEYSDSIYIENGAGCQKGTALSGSIDIEKRDLLRAAFLLLHMKEEIFDRVQFTSTGGVASNLLRSMIASNHNDRGVVTVLTAHGFDRISRDVPIMTVKGFTGKLGQDVQSKFHVSTLGELRDLSSKQLKRYFPHSDSKIIFNTARGRCGGRVAKERIKPEIVCSKQEICVKANKELRGHLDDLSEEMLYRLHEELVRNKREPMGMKISYNYFYLSDDTRKEHLEEIMFVYVHSRSQSKNHVALLAQRCYQGIRVQRGLQFRNQIITSLNLVALHFIDKAPRDGERYAGINERWADEIHGLHDRVDSIDVKHAAAKYHPHVSSKMKNISPPDPYQRSIDLNDRGLREISSSKPDPYRRSSFDLKLSETFNNTTPPDPYQRSLDLKDRRFMDKSSNQTDPHHREFNLKERGFGDKLSRYPDAHQPEFNLNERGFGEKLSKHPDAYQPEFKFNDREFGEKLSKHPDAYQPEFNLSDRGYGEKLSKHPDAYQPEFKFNDREFGGRLSKHQEPSQPELNFNDRGFGEKLSKHSDPYQPEFNLNDRGFGEKLSKHPDAYQPEFNLNDRGFGDKLSSQADPYQREFNLKERGFGDKSSVQHDPYQRTTDLNDRRFGDTSLSQADPYQREFNLNDRGFGDKSSRQSDPYHRSSDLKLSSPLKHTTPHDPYHRPFDVKGGFVDKTSSRAVYERQIAQLPQENSKRGFYDDSDWTN